MLYIDLDTMMRLSRFVVRRSSHPLQWRLTESDSVGHASQSVDLPPGTINVPIIEFGAMDQLV
jgi:hypothetical protein